MKSVMYAAVAAAVAAFVWSAPVAQAGCGACPAGAKAAAPSSQPVQAVAVAHGTGGSGGACAKSVKAEGAACAKSAKGEGAACDKSAKTVAAKEGGCCSKAAKTVAASDAAGNCEKKDEKAKLAAAE